MSKTEKKNEKEIRMLSKNLRSLEDSKEMIVEGYAVVFNSPDGTDYYTEIIDRNAFNGCDMKDVCFKYNHDSGHSILARTRNKSLELAVDDVGLKIRAKLIDTQPNKDIYKMIQAGLLDKMSFAFTVSEEEWDYDTDTRRILSINKLFDVSVVDVPFYDATSIYARSLEKLESGKANLERLKEQRKNKIKSLDLRARLLEMKGE